MEAKVKVVMRKIWTIRIRKKKTIYRAHIDVRHYFPYSIITHIIKVSSGSLITKNRRQSHAVFAH